MHQDGRLNARDAHTVFGRGWWTHQRNSQENKPDILEKCTRDSKIFKRHVDGDKCEPVLLTEYLVEKYTSDT